MAFKFQIKSEISNIIKELIPKLKDFFPNEFDQLNKICLKICNQTIQMPIFYSNKTEIVFEASTLILLKIQQLINGLLAIDKNQKEEKPLKLIDLIKKIIEFVCSIDIQKVGFIQKKRLFITKSGS